MITSKMIENMLRDLGDTYSFEELLAMFDLEPVDVFILLYNNGFIDEDILEN